MEFISKLAFALDHYMRLGALAVGAFGLGYALIAPIIGRAFPILLLLALSCSTGLGLLALCFLLLGLLGRFDALSLATVVALAFVVGVLAAYDLARRRRRSPECLDLGELTVLRQVSPWVWLAIALAMLPYLLRPLNPPLEWDELMYHLPYVRFWVEQGRLAIDEGSRYPYFPYAYHMLYVPAFVLGSDVLPHLVHGLAGWLTAALIVSFGVRHYGPAVALVAMVLFLAGAGSWQFSSAYIDLALTLFVNAALLTLLLARQERRDGWFYVSALLIGMAAGTKYQALTFCLLWLVLALALRPRPSVLAGALLIAVIAGGFWYLRNVIVTGDPFHPLGGELFGFHLWDTTDLKDQLADARKGIDPPPPFLWLPALGALALWRTHAGVTRQMLLVAAAMVLVWLVTSGNERYLMPALPLLSLLAALALVQTWHWVTARLQSRVRLSPALLRASPAVFVLLVALAFWPQSRKAWDRIAVTHAARDETLAGRLGAYQILRRLAAEPGIGLYQIGFEGQLYYAPRNTVGEHFGKYRYRNVYALANDPAALARHFCSLGLNAMLINDDPRAHRGLQFAPNMADYFELAEQTPTHRLYRLKAACEEQPKP